MVADPDPFAEAAFDVVRSLDLESADAIRVKQELKRVVAEFHAATAIDPARQRAERRARLQTSSELLNALQKSVDVLEQAPPPLRRDLERLLARIIGPMLSNRAFRDCDMPIYSSVSDRVVESHQRRRDWTSLLAAELEDVSQLRRSELARRYGAEVLCHVLSRLQLPLREQLAFERANAPEGRPADLQRYRAIGALWVLYMQLTGAPLPKQAPGRFKIMCIVTIELFGIDPVGLDEAIDRLFQKARRETEKGKRKVQA